MIAAYRERRENEVNLARAAAVATPESFAQVMAEAFPPRPLVLAEGNIIAERWWGGA